MSKIGKKKVRITNVDKNRKSITLLIILFIFGVIFGGCFFLKNTETEILSSVLEMDAQILDAFSTRKYQNQKHHYQNSEANTPSITLLKTNGGSRYENHEILTIPIPQIIFFLPA